MNGQRQPWELRQTCVRLEVQFQISPSLNYRWDLSRFQWWMLMWTVKVFSHREISNKEIKEIKTRLPKENEKSVFQVRNTFVDNRASKNRFFSGFLKLFSPCAEQGIVGVHSSWGAGGNPSTGGTTCGSIFWESIPGLQSSGQSHRAGFHRCPSQHCC